MGFGRVLSSCLALVAVAGCAAVAIGLGQASSGPGGTDTDAAYVAPTFEGRSYPPTTWTWSTTASTTSSARTVPTSHPATRSATPSATPTSTVSSAKLSTSAPPAGTAARTSSSTSAPTVVRGQSLPLGYSTGLATRVITVVAHSSGSTTATLQAWVKAPGGGWLKHGSAVLAHVGSQGLTSQPSESKSATPIGSFTLTQAFGARSNPGTGLPYFRTTSADWWISQTTGTGAALYNTHQHCSSGCSFIQGDPNEHLVYETPYYNYAVVIDYNTRNAPGGVHVGAGSAFFLHVTDGAPTAGCVAIPQSDLVSVMQWLTPTARPRILIGVA